MVETPSLVKGISEMKCEKHKCKLVYSHSCMQFYCPKCTEEAEVAKKNARGLTVLRKVEAEGIITPPSNVVYEQKTMVSGKENDR